MLSATYQQASARRADAATADPNNDLYWRFDRRRLERRGDPRQPAGGERPARPHARRGRTRSRRNRRGTTRSTSRSAPSSRPTGGACTWCSVRNRRHPFLGLFDGADPNATHAAAADDHRADAGAVLPERPVLPRPGRRSWPARVLAKPDDASGSTSCSALALQRPPTAKDREFAAAFLDALPRRRWPTSPPPDRPKAAWAALARVLLASNEFLFVE